MIIMTALRIIRIIMIMAVILTMKTIIPMMIQRITMTLPERSSLQLLLLSQWVYLWWSFFAIVAGYKIFGFGGTNNKTTNTAKPKTTVAADDDSKGGVFVDTESSAVSTDTNTTTSQPADESSTPATETSAPDTETTTTTTTTASDTETTTTTTTTADSKPDETTTTTSAESGDSAKAVAAITAQIDGKVSSYEYRTEDAGLCTITSLQKTATATVPHIIRQTAQLYLYRATDFK